MEFSSGEVPNQGFCLILTCLNDEKCFMYDTGQSFNWGPIVCSLEPQIKKVEKAFKHLQSLTEKSEDPFD